jgi:hypothetical protein
MSTDYHHRECRPWTDADAETLRKLWPQPIQVKDIAKRMKRNPGHLAQYAKTLGIYDLRTPANAGRWAPEWIERLKELFAQGKTRAQMAKILSDETGRTFTKNAIVSKVNRYNMAKTVKRNEGAYERNVSASRARYPRGKGHPLQLNGECIDLRRTIAKRKPVKPASWKRGSAPSQPKPVKEPPLVHYDPAVHVSVADFDPAKHCHTVKGDVRHGISKWGYCGKPLERRGGVWCPECKARHYAPARQGGDDAQAA